MPFSIEEINADAILVPILEGLKLATNIKAIRLHKTFIGENGKESRQIGEELDIITEKRALEGNDEKNVILKQEAGERKVTAEEKNAKDNDFMIKAHEMKVKTLRTSVFLSANDKHRKKALSHSSVVVTQTKTGGSYILDAKLGKEHQRTEALLWAIECSISRVQKCSTDMWKFVAKMRGKISKMELKNDRKKRKNRNNASDSDDSTSDSSISSSGSNSTIATSESSEEDIMLSLAKSSKVHFRNQDVERAKEAEKETDINKTKPSLADKLKAINDESLRNINNRLNILDNFRRAGRKTLALSGFQGARGRTRRSSVSVSVSGDRSSVNGATSVRADSSSSSQVPDRKSSTASILGLKAVPVKRSVM